MREDCLTQPGRTRWPFWGAIHALELLSRMGCAFDNPRGQRKADRKGKEGGFGSEIMVRTVRTDQFWVQLGPKTAEIDLPLSNFDTFWV